MDDDTDSDYYTGPLVRDHEEKKSVPRATSASYRNAGHSSWGSETRHERSKRNDGVSRGVYGGQSCRNTLTWNRSSNHTAAPTGSWRNINREANGGARPKERNTSWRRNNWEKEVDLNTHIDRQEPRFPRRRAASQGGGSALQSSDTTESRVSRDFFRRPGKISYNGESTASIPTSLLIPGEETKWHRGQSDVRSDLGKYTGQVQVRQSPMKPPISEEELKTLVKDSPRKVLAKLLSKKDEWLAFLNQDSFNDNIMTLTLSVLSGICDLNVDPKIKQDVHMAFSMIESSEFLSKHLTRYLVGVPTQQPKDQDSSNSETLSNNIKMMLRLLQVSLEHKPGLYDEVGVVLILLEKVVSLVDSDCADFHNYMIQVQQLKECYNSPDGSRQTQQKIKVEPPSNFRDIKIFPVSSEIRKPTKPFLRKNIIKGRYEDVEHYLDVQFRLLREDFVAPLREGITEFLSVANSRHQDIRVYRNVSIQSKKVGKQGLQYTLQFDVENLKRVNWGKRLLYGSLVCLTNDKFKHIVCASVADRETKDLEQGLVDVCFLTETSSTPTGTYDMMVESVAYFEAYRHVLLGLQRMKSDNFPFERYIVNVSSNIRTPKYLRGDDSDVYDLRALVVGTVKKFGFEVLLENFVNAACVPILTTENWPAAKALHLDESQKVAVQAALTKEFAVIQGPPGTGKTYIGLKIIELLLYNTHKTPDSSPILVVCYTNHALDQFLEGVLNFGEENLVRVGGRSNSEKLKYKNLTHLKKQRKFTFRQELAETKKRLRELEETEECLQELEETKRRLQELEETKESLLELNETRERIQRNKSAVQRTLSNVAVAKMVILKVKSLEKSMSDNHQKSFQKSKKRDGDPTTNLLNWLNVVDIEYESDSPVFSDFDEDQNDFIDGDERSEQQECHIDDEDDSSSSDDEREQQECFDLGKIAAYNIEFKKRCGINLESTPKNEIKKDDVMSDREASRARNVWTLTLSDRWRLYRLWVRRYIEEQEKFLTTYRMIYDSLSTELEAMNASEDLEILPEARVIGMTTTGAARCQSVLQLLGPRIVIVEEAAEILEAHIITALTAKCQHLILIGDHQQLKPNPTVYRLAKVFNLDTSLFERMINNGVPCQTLTHQHRMRPEISKLMKKHFYKNLHDDESVMGFDDIKGVAHNMFFIDHNQFEDGSRDDNKTKSNQHEAEVLVELCRYLLHQGYEPTQITILTTYLGQLFTFNNLMHEKTFEKVRVSVVDNFQGEENDIILLSLVRSNAEGSIGFLKTSNRVCVALSRARLGFYCIGNARILRKSSIWNGIISTLDHEKKICSSIPLVCQNHAEVTRVASARDFKEKVQDGGCGKPCGYRLPCDHICHLQCHPFDLDHEKYKCTEPCAHLCDRKEHACPMKCHETCGPCFISVPKLMPNCGHVVQVYCDKFNSITCPEPCPRSLPCGHPCRNACGDECTTNCTVEVCKPMPQCGHVVQVQCSKFDSVTLCTGQCPRSLPCGHPCSNTCGDECTTKCTVQVSKTVTKCGHGVLMECARNPDLIPCTHLCDKLLVCGHRCPRKCSQSCPKERMDVAKMKRHAKIYDDFQQFCTEKCERSVPCGHPCQNKCGEPCSKEGLNSSIGKYITLFNGVSMSKLSMVCETIIQKQNPKCGHTVAVPCYTDFASFPCPETCNKELSCGHRCTDKCGVPCKCKMRVNRKLPSCGHSAQLPCYQDFYSYKCEKNCHKMLPCGHPCSNKCWEPCPTDGEDSTSETPRNSPAKTCQRSVRKMFPGCDHSVVLPCSQDVESIVCIDKCTRVLSCGHECPNQCCDPCPSSYPKDGEDSPSETPGVSPAKTCQRSVRKKFPGCDHSVVLPCYKSVDSVVCSKKCIKVLSCGHKCPNRCGEPCPRSSPTLEETYSDWSDDSNSSSEQDDLYVRKCKQHVNKKIPSCGHVIESPCYKRVESLVCPKPCEKTLPCGHRCENKCGEPCPSEECTSDEEEMEGNEFAERICQITVYKQLPDCLHFMNLPCYKKAETAECSNPCERLLKCGHQCPNKCGEACLSSEECDELVEKTLPGCGHKVETHCCNNPKSVTCTQKCEKMLPCGHVCSEKCNDPCPGESIAKRYSLYTRLLYTRLKVKCKELVEKDLPCGHVTRLLCWQVTDSTAAITYCREPCGHTHKCGHKCLGTCGYCRRLGGEHNVCDIKCGNLLLCGHRCSEECGKDVCSPHRLCSRSSRAISRESIMRSKCQHQQIRDKIQTTSCNFPCIQKLRCNHFCIGVCGEPCPPVCRICNKKDVADKYPEGPVRPEETFIYLRDCGHLCETRLLDEMFAGFQTSTTGCVQIRPALCPKCKTPIRKCRRYDDIIQTVKESVDLAEEKCEESPCYVRLSFAVAGWMRCPEGHVFCQDDASDDSKDGVLCPDCPSTPHSVYSSDDMEM